MVAVEHQPYIVASLSDKLRSDKDVILSAVTQYGLLLEFARGDLVNDRDVILAAVKQNGYSLKYASEELQRDKEVLSAARQSIETMRYISELY